MPSHADRSVALNALFDLDAALACGRVTPTAQTWQKPKSDTEEMDELERISDLARFAIRRSSGKSILEGSISPRLSRHYIDAFCRLLLLGKLNGTLDLARMYMRRGADYGEIAEQLFSMAAICLGDRWDVDKATMIEVNIGISTLLRTDIALRSSFCLPTETHDRCALFGFLQCQPHTLGITFAAQYFRQNGWNTHYMPATTLEEFADAAEKVSPSIVGLTAGSDMEVSLLSLVIQELRRLPNMPKIIVGGSSPHLPKLGADAVVSGLDMALLASERLLGERLV